MGKDRKRIVFLGGTCAESNWREILIDLLEIDYYNPVVEDWTPECMEEEIRQRKECDYVLYVITPRMRGVYSIAEAVDDSNKIPERTIFCVQPIDIDENGEFSKFSKKFSKAQLKSFEAVKNMIKENGGTVCDTLREVADFLNKA